MEQQLNKVLNEAFAESCIKDKDEKRFHKQIEQEAKDGKRDFWILRNGHGTFSLYPIGHKTVEFVTCGDIEKYKQRGYLKIVPRIEVTKLLRLRDDIYKVNKRYNNFLEKVFKRIKEEDWENGNKK